MIWKSRNRLKWYLNFIALEIAQLKVVDYYRLLGQYKAIPNVLKFEYIKNRHFPDDRLVHGKITNIQEAFMSMYDYLGAEVPDDVKKDLLPVVEDQKRFREFVCDILTKMHEPKYTDKDLASGRQSDILKLSVIETDEGNCFEIRKKPIIEDEIDTVKNDFMTCLDGVPVTSIKRCPECDNWFYQPTKKEKIYCNNRCASRYIVRKKRREQKEATSEQYREEKTNGAKRARKSYEKKIREATPKAKIARRPTKHKEA